MTPFVFLFEDGESPGDRIARCCKQAGAAGPMGAHLDPERYQAFLAVWRRERQLRFVRTSCAVTAAAVLGWCGKPMPYPWRADGAWGITSWLALAFNHPSWCWAEDGVPEPGAVFYRDYSRKTTSSGHVGIFVERHADGLWTTFEGGGWLAQGDAPELPSWQRRATNGTVTRLSKPKDPRAKDNLKRSLIGWWRPALIGLTDTVPPSYSDTEPAPPMEAK